MPFIRPVEEGIIDWHQETLLHCVDYHYFIGPVSTNLGVAVYDPEWPHDLNGESNKYDWPVSSGLALAYDGVRANKFVRHLMYQSRELHRQQRHHRMGNTSNLEATEGDRLSSVVDTVRSMRADSALNRRNNGGPYSYDQILRVLEKEAPHKLRWYRAVAGEMERLPTPELGEISLSHIPNIGIPHDIHAQIVSRTRDTIRMLREDHGYVLEGV
jgi:hypothetical protein